MQFPYSPHIRQLQKPGESPVAVQIGVGRRICFTRRTFALVLMLRNISVGECYFTNRSLGFVMMLEKICLILAS